MLANMFANLLAALLALATLATGQSVYTVFEAGHLENGWFLDNRYYSIPAGERDFTLKPNDTSCEALFGQLAPPRYLKVVVWDVDVPPQITEDRDSLVVKRMSDLKTVSSVIMQIQCALY